MNLKSIYTRLLYISYFFFSWGIGFTVYSNSRVIESINGRESVGIIYAIAAGMSLVFSTWITPSAIKILGNRRVAGLAIMLELLAIVGIRYFENPMLFAVSFMLFLIAQILISFSYDIFFEHNTLKDNSGRARGLVVSLQHIGRMLGPAFAAAISISYGVRIPYQISFILILITGFFLFFATKNFKDKSYVPNSFITSVKAILKRPELRKPIMSILLLQTFYGLMVTFVPIFLAENRNMSAESLGMLFTIMLSPFVVLSYPIGKSLDNGASGRLAARYGLIIMILSTVLFPILDTSLVLVWAIVLIASRLGAAILETAGEGIFFKNIKEEETELLGIMRDMQPVGYFIAAFVGVIALLIGPIDYIFYIVAIILTVGVFLTHKKVKHEN